MIAATDEGVRCAVALGRNVTQSRRLRHDRRTSHSSGEEQGSFE